MHHTIFNNKGGGILNNEFLAHKLIKNSFC